MTHFVAVLNIHDSDTQEFVFCQHLHKDLNNAIFQKVFLWHNRFVIHMINTWTTDCMTSHLYLRYRYYFLSIVIHSSSLIDHQHSWIKQINLLPTWQHRMANPRTIWRQKIKLSPTRKNQAPTMQHVLFPTRKHQTPLVQKQEILPIVKRCHRKLHPLTIPYQLAVG